MYTRIVTCIIAFSMLAAHIAHGDDAPVAVPEPTKPATKIVQLTVSPAVPPVPALKYRLTPRFIDQQPGNAAPLYLKATLLLAEARIEAETYDKINKWLEMPVADVPRDEVRSVLDQFNSPLTQVQLATRREHCHWELALREQLFYDNLLPELSPLQKLARVLALRSRLQIAEGKFDDALATLTETYTLAGHVAAGPTLIHGLVGLSIASNANAQLRTLIEQPSSPNLYWTITGLPQPLIDLRPALDLEADGAFYAFPQLRDVDRRQLSPDEWKAELNELTEKGLSLLPMLGAVGENEHREWKDILAIANLTITAQPKAAAGLERYGYEKSTIAAMPPAQQILLYTHLTYRDLRDDPYKNFNLPIWQAMPGVRAAEQRLGEEGRQREIIPLATLLLPAVSQARLSVVRVDRELAALRTVEALRDYAATHEGKFPARLDDITNLPVPLDPMTGKSFGYVAEGNEASLSGPALLGEESRPNSTLEWVIKLRK